MLIAMAVYDTVANQRSDLTLATLHGLEKTVNFTRHRLFVCDNGSCDETKGILERYQQIIPFTVLTNEENLGTAVAINRAWALRRDGEHCVKMDNDVFIHDQDWPDFMEAAFRKDPQIGICGLKRKDIAEWPLRDDWWKSRLYALPHEPGERWMVAEEVGHVIGTCQGYNSALLDKMGYLYQMQDEGNLYGFDDSLAACRAKVLGFKSVFLPWINIDHIDPGGDYYSEWKKLQAHKFSPRFHQVRDEYESGDRDPYYGGP